MLLYQLCVSFITGALKYFKCHWNKPYACNCSIVQDDLEKYFGLLLLMCFCFVLLSYHVNVLFCVSCVVWCLLTGSIFRWNWCRDWIGGMSTYVIKILYAFHFAFFKLTNKRSTKYKGSHYAVFSSILLFFPSYVQTFSSVPFSNNLNPLCSSLMFINANGKGKM